MVALNEKFHHKGTLRRLRGTGAGRASRIQELGVRILWKRWAAECEMPDAGQGLQFLDDLPIDQCSLVIERNARNRNYDPTLGRWINQDPAGYINGANTYQFVESNPVNAVDPWGLQMHHIIPQGLYDLDNDTRIPFSQAAVRVFKEATLDAPYHVNFSKQHFAYNNAVRAAIEKYLADHGICPTEMTTQEAKNLVKAIRSSNNKIIKWFLKGITTTPSFLDKLGDFLKRFTEGTENIPMFIVLPVDILRDLVPQPINAGAPPPTA